MELMVWISASRLNLALILTLKVGSTSDFERRRCARRHAQFNSARAPHLASKKAVGAKRARAPHLVTTQNVCKDPAEVAESHLVGHRCDPTRLLSRAT